MGNIVVKLKNGRFRTIKNVETVFVSKEVELLEDDIERYDEELHPEGNSLRKMPDIGRDLEQLQQFSVTKPGNPPKESLRLGVSA